MGTHAAFTHVMWAVVAPPSGLFIAIAYLTVDGFALLQIEYFYEGLCRVVDGQAQNPVLLSCVFDLVVATEAEEGVAFRGLLLDT